MKRKIPIMLIVIILLQIALPMLTVIWESEMTLISEAVTSGDWKYRVNSDGETIELTDYTGSDTELSIPSSIDGYTVTGIGESAFNYCNSLTSITIPEGVISIGDFAFFNCSSLTSITIPSSVTSIGSYVFNGCSSLTSINVDENNSIYGSENGILFNKNKTRLIKYPAGKEKNEYEIPEGLTSIGRAAFNDCKNLTNIEIPNSVTEIIQGAFSGCTGLTSITIPEGVTKIDYDLFYNCSALTNVTIPEGVRSIGGDAFNGCSSLRNIEIPTSVEGIYSRAFKGCTSLTNIIIPLGVTKISDEVFNGCSSLTSINVDENNSIYGSENGILFNKDKTELIKYPEGKEDNTYQIPKGVTSIGDFAFFNCSSLTSVTIPSSVTNMGYRAFDNCISLTRIIIPRSVISLNGGVQMPLCDNVTIVCNENSCAKNFAINTNMSYEIDDIAPIITSVEGNPTDWTKESVTLTVNASDSLSGLAEEAYSFDGGATWQAENTKTYTENTSGIVIKVRDNLNNITTYEEEINITKIIKLTEINITNGPVKTNYIEGQVFDKTGMVVTATYDNGTTEEITEGYECTPTTLNTVGSQIITVTYEGKTTTFNVTVTLKGDANGDSKVDFMDILAVNKHRLGKAQLTGIYLEAADVNGDGNIDFMDILQINKYRLGKINSL